MTPKETLVMMFDSTFEVKGTTRVYPTRKGYHLIAEHRQCNFIGIAEMRDSLKAFDKALPNAGVDVGATSTLRPAGARDKIGWGRKEMPAGTTLSQHLVQPLDAPEDEVPDPMEYITCDADIRAGIAALTDDAESLSWNSRLGASHMLNRSTPSACKACGGRVHDSQGARLIIRPGEQVGMAY
jgi:hypothetical protein